MGLKAIVDGHIKETFGQNQTLSDQRMAICKQCPLLKNTQLGPVCNSKLWLNLDTNEVSEKKQPGFQNGCGCRLTAKTRLTYAHCPLGKW